MAVKPIPDGYPQVMPYLIVRDVPRLIDFLSTVFGGKEMSRHDDGNGKVVHAEVRIGDSVVMMGEAGPQWPASPASIMIYVEDTDAAYARALKAGATSLTEPENKFYGDRNANVRDPFGNQWFISTRVEALSSEEMTSRSDAYSQTAANRQTHGRDEAG